MLHGTSMGIDVGACEQTRHLATCIYDRVDTEIESRAGGESLDQFATIGVPATRIGVAPLTFR